MGTQYYNTKPSGGDFLYCMPFPIVGAICRRFVSFVSRWQPQKNMEWCHSLSSGTFFGMSHIVRDFQVYDIEGILVGRVSGLKQRKVNLIEAPKALMGSSLRVSLYFLMVQGDFIVSRPCCGQTIGGASAPRKDWVVMSTINIL